MPVARLAVLATLFIALFGCKSSPVVLPSTAVSSAESGMRVDPGPEFQATGATSSPPMVCLPTLTGASGITWALLLPIERTDPAQAAASLRANEERDPASVPGSFQQSEFRSESGLSGVLVTRLRRTVSRGRTVDAHSYSFIVPNGLGRYVAVEYLTTTDMESPAVVEAIRRSIPQE